MAYDIIKVKMRHNPASAGSETCKFKMTIFDNGILEKLLQFLLNVKNTIEGNGATTVAGIIQFLHMLLRVKSLQEFDILESRNNGTANAHFKETNEDLIE